MKLPCTPKNPERIANYAKYSPTENESGEKYARSPLKPTIF